MKKPLLLVDAIAVNCLLQPLLQLSLRLLKLVIATAVMACACTTAPALSQVVISQIYGGGGNSGAPYRHDFIELFNRGDSAVDIGNWSVQYASAAGSAWAVTPLPALVLEPGQYLLVQQAGGGTGAALPPADASGVSAIASRAGKVLLSSTRTAFRGANPAGPALVDLVGYGAASAFETAPAPAPSNTLAIVRLHGACSETEHNAADFIAAAPLPRNRATARHRCGAPPSLPGVSHTIAEIQGSGPASPYAGTVQTTEGVLTVKVGSGFFIQDPAGDGDPLTSDALFVYGAAHTNAANVADALDVGARVRVTGTVAEYTPAGASRSYTELTEVSAVLALGPGSAVQPLAIALSEADLPHMEAMLVRLNDALSVTDTQYLGTRGELGLSLGRREAPTNRYRPGSPEALALAASNRANLIVLDDGLFVAPPRVPYLGLDGTVRAGDSVSGLTGVIDFGPAGGGMAVLKLQPAAAPLFSRDNPRTAAPPAMPGNVKVASANVLNFFTTFADGDDVFGQHGQLCQAGDTRTRANCRGAGNLAEFVRQRDKIVAALLAIDADVLGLMEIQNNGETAVTYLADQLNATLGAPVYASVPAPDTSGGDAIRVAMLYQPGKLRLFGATLSDPDPVHNRAPLAQGFEAANGARFSVIVNHFKSKGGCPSDAGAEANANADHGDGQGCWNATRVAQAQRLSHVFAPQVALAAGDPDLLLIGDLNAYGAEDPVQVITGAGFVNELERHVRPQAMPYSYVFGGESGYLDHALASTSLSGQVAGVLEWHINADEPSVLDYQIGGKPQDLYQNTPYRASDHDPVIVSLDLCAQAADATQPMTQQVMRQQARDSAAPVPAPVPAASAATPLLQQIRALVGAAACTDSAQCRTLALGAKPCGGPESYLAWSGRETAAAQLATLAARYRSERLAAQAVSGALSDCRLVNDPGAVCAAAAGQPGRCVVRAAGGGAADPR